ncbi:phosphogluconate dehydrogenase [Annulohypoxylon stygium]|nr:phosphogluconate dehydrogenase [Annulohypoxylon stygium]
MSEQTALSIGILSIGDMGLGIGKVLMSQNYRVMTFAEDRRQVVLFECRRYYSERTKERARSNKIELLPSVRELVQQSDCLLSIVPPRDALATAQSVFSATPSGAGTRKHPLYYLDLNAIAPSIATQTQSLFEGNPNIVLIDGGIIGGVPYPKVASPIGWNCPSLIVSGPTKLPYTNLSRVLNIVHLTDQIGAASGLKMCFASTTKGFFALAIQSFVTADALGVLSPLRDYMMKYNAKTLEIADKGVISMPPKAYRWVNEMQQIGTMMKENGGFDTELFDGVAEVYRVVAEDTELGQEQPGQRVRGTTIDDVVKLMRSGMDGKRELD